MTSRAPAPPSAKRAPTKKSKKTRKKTQSAARETQTAAREPQTAAKPRAAAATTRPATKKATTQPATVTRLKILGMEEVPSGTELVVARGWGSSDAATNPCAHCPSKCCEFQIALTTVEALRMGYALRLPFADFLDVAPMSYAGAERFAHALDLDVGPSKLVLKRTDGWCTHLLRPGTPQSRCGVYELRPAVCRLFPFLFELDGEEMSVGNGNPICPVRWAVTPETAERLERDARRFKDDVASDAELAARWNGEGRVDRSLAAFFVWLRDEAGPLCGHHPSVFGRFPERPKFAFLKATTRQMI